MRQRVCVTRVCALSATLAQRALRQSTRMRPTVIRVTTVRVEAPILSARSHHLLRTRVLVILQLKHRLHAPFVSSAYQRNQITLEQPSALAKIFFRAVLLI